MTRTEVGLFGDVGEPVDRPPQEFRDTQIIVGVMQPLCFGLAVEGAKHRVVGPLGSRRAHLQ